MKVSRLIVALATLSLLIPTVFANITHPSNDDLQEYTTKNDASYERIFIDSDDDFEAQGWPGRGTADNPYVISNLNIMSYRESIWIQVTTSHFVIKNSTFKSWTEDAVVFASVSNGHIQNCTVSADRTAGTAGIRVYSSTNVSISNNLIHGSHHGIYLIQSTRCNVSGNFMTLNVNGIKLASSDIMIQNNTITSNSDDGLRLTSEAINNTMRFNKIAGCYRGLVMERESTNNSFYGNKVGWTELWNAYDSGVSNRWDDNTSMGNAWDDYNGSGTYLIHGDSGSVDRYPSILSEDILGPTIIADLYGSLIIDYSVAPSHFRFEAIVTDVSGVDTVLINANNEWYRMDYSPTTEKPDRYLCDVPFQEGGYIFYYWANDTLGNTAMTRTGDITLGIYDGSIPTNIEPPPPELAPFLMSAVVVGTVLAVIILAIYTQQVVSGKRPLSTSI